MKRCSTSLSIKEMQIETKMRYYLIPIRMAFVKRQQMTSVGKDMEKRKPLCTVGGNVNWCSHSGKHFDLKDHRVYLLLVLTLRKLL